MPLNEVFNNLGAAQARRHDTAAAIANFQKALEGDSADPDYHFNLGYTEWRAASTSPPWRAFAPRWRAMPAIRRPLSMLGRALKQEGPRPGEPKIEERERLKTNYEESAYRQLQAELEEVGVPSQETECRTRKEHVKCEAVPSPRSRGERRESAENTKPKTATVNEAAGSSSVRF